MLYEPFAGNGFQRLFYFEYASKQPPDDTEYIKAPEAKPAIHDNFVRCSNDHHD